MLVLLAMALAALAAACGGRSQPVVGDRGRQDRPRRVAVVVPGVTGSVLRYTDDGTVAWGRGRNLVGPRDGGYALALPIVGKPKRPLVPGGLLMRLRLLFLGREIYRPLVDTLLADGYRLGDLAAPRPEADLYLFAYDWRQDNLRSASQLAERLERVRRARGEDRLAVDLLCQSNGAMVCRWLARFGGASLTAAEEGAAMPPAAIDVHQLLLIGTANGGSVRTLREMTRGRRYLRVVGRRFEPEVFFTVPAFFQDLPSYRDDLFVDERGEAIDADVFATDDWKRYGWSIFGARAARSLSKRKPPPGLFGGDDDRDAHLRSMLGRARRIHRVLAGATAPGPSTRYHLIQNLSWHTPDRAVLRSRPEGGYELWTAGDKALRRRPQLAAAVTARGDGHATRASALHLGAGERAALVGDVLEVEAAHFETILEPAAQRRMLEVLAAP